MQKFLFYNKFIILLYMFRALCAHHQEVKLYYTAFGIITPVGGRPVCRLREDWSSLNLRRSSQRSLRLLGLATRLFQQ